LVREGEFTDGIRRGRGRPKKDSGVYDHTVNVRLNDEQMALLHDLEYELDMNRTEVIRKALETFHNIKIRWR
jgi:hypothetical protein